MKQKIQHIKSLFQNNSKVAENYFFMTSLQVATILINLLLFPYLIRTLGKEAYGTYIFILSNVQLFIFFFASGFSFPALKKISLNTDNLQVKNQTISEIFSAKFILFSLCGVVLVVCAFFVPFVQDNLMIYIIIFSMMAFGDMLFPLWYFQGMQKMSFVTYVNLGVRLCSVPLILIFVKSPDDLLIFTIIMSVLPFLGSVFTFFYLKLKDKISLRFVSLKSLKPVFKDTVPFYWTSAFSQLKNEGVKIFVGIFWGMGSVAVYDLANKIVSIASVFTNSINTAIFPKIIKDLNAERIKRILRYETLIGLSAVFLVIVFGYWAVLFLGGKEMLGAYPLVIVLSFTVYFSLIIGCYVNCIFVPQNRYYFVSKAKLTAMISFVGLASVGLIIYPNIIVLALVFTLSHLIEVFYCKYVTKKYQLL